MEKYFNDEFDDCKIETQVYEKTANKRRGRM